jgi:hypothetical protein
LQLAVERMGGSITEAEAEAMLERADDMPQQRTADKLAKFLGVTYPQRQQLGLTTIGSIDVPRRGRILLRKRRRRLNCERSRRAGGARPRADYEAKSLARTKPWEAQGMSRRSWYRKRGTSPRPATPPPTKWHKSEASHLILGRHTLVPPERKQGASRGGVRGQGTEQTPLPTLAARGKLCGLRHNGPLSLDLCQEAAECPEAELEPEAKPFAGATPEHYCGPAPGSKPRYVLSSDPSALKKYLGTFERLPLELRMLALGIGSRWKTSSDERNRIQ